jgi:hypothetical protein
MFNEANMFNQKHETMEKHHNHEELFDQEWEKSQKNELIEALKAGEGFQEKLFALPGFKEAFAHKLTCLECSDGRVNSHLGKLALAGEGLLLDSSDREILVKAIKEQGLTITGHENCGAAGIAHPGPDSDNYGYQKAKELVADTGNTYDEVHADKFTSPVHNERTLVLEGTGRFNVADLEGFPGQFISSASHFGLSAEYQKTEAKALIGIALGDHSFGKRFDKENPFYLIVSAKDEAQYDELAKMAEEIAADYDGLVKVNGFIAPQEVLAQQV